VLLLNECLFVVVYFVIDSFRKLLDTHSYVVMLLSYTANGSLNRFLWREDKALLSVAKLRRIKLSTG
jgi:hypothetical protein